MELKLTKMLPLLLIVVLLTYSPLAAISTVSAATITSLTMREAVDLGLKYSQEIRDAKSEIEKKKIELEQAYHAVKSEEAKASGLFAKPNNIGKDIQTKTKVPEAKKQLYLAQEKLREATESVKLAMTQLYLQTLQDAYAEDAAKRKWELARAQVDAVRTKLKYGLIDQEAKEAADKLLEKAASDWKQAQLTSKASRLAIGGKINQKLENPISLFFEPDYADLSQGILPKYIANAQKTNMGLLQTVEDRKTADEKLNLTRNLYSSKFGAGRMMVMESMFRAKEMDLELFLATYEATLTGVRKDWQGYFMLFGFIPIPKVLLQGEFDGLRYLDDLRNVLPISAMEQNKAATKENESRNTVIAAIRTSYLAAKGAEEGYAQALRDRDAAEVNLDKANKTYRLGLLKAEELQKVKDALATADTQIFAAQMTYKTAISKLNFDTGGAVDQTLRRGVLPYKDIDDGLQAVKPAPNKAASGKWQLKPAVGPLLSDFTVTANKRLKATDYALFNKEGKPIGKKTPVGKKIRYLTLQFSKPEELKVVLYSKDEAIGEFQVAGSGTGGTIEAPEVKPGDGEGSAPSALTPTPSDSKASEGTLIIGSYKVLMEALTPEVYNAAAASMNETGQGILFKSELAGGAWFGMDNATEPEAITDPKGALSAAEVAAVKVTMEITKLGELSTLMTTDELAKALATLVKDKEKLDIAKEEAVADQKLSQVGELAVQIKEVEAKIGMLTALQKGDAKAAMQQMALVNNADALIEALAEETEASSGEDGGEGDGTGSGDGSGNGTGTEGEPAGSEGNGEGTPGGSETGSGTETGEPDSGSVDNTKLSDEELAAKQEQLQAKVAEVLASGNAEAAIEQSKQLLATMKELEDRENGTTEGLAALAEAKQLLTDSLEEAKANQEEERIAALNGSLEAVAEAAIALAKEALFVQIDAVELMILGLGEGAAAPVTPQEEAQAKLLINLNEQLEQLLEQVKEKENEKYTEEELKQLAELSAVIEQASEGEAKTLSIDQVISKDFVIKFEVPPVIIGGNAYLPIRAISESFGAAVDWDDETLTVTVSTEDGVVECTINNSIAYVDGEAIQIDMPPLLIEGYTFVPLRFMTESIGLQVQWNEQAQTINLSE
jgi:hypothetical protein